MRRVILALMGAAFAVAANAAAPKPSVPKLPRGVGRDLVQTKCSTCHALPIVTTKRKTAEEWEASIDTMMTRGMQLSDAEFDVVASYLTKNFGVKKK